MKLALSHPILHDPSAIKNQRPSKANLLQTANTAATFHRASADFLRFPEVSGQVKEDGGDLHLERYVTPGTPGHTPHVTTVGSRVEVARHGTIRTASWRKVCSVPRLATSSPKSDRNRSWRRATPVLRRLCKLDFVHFVHFVFSYICHVFLMFSTFLYHPTVVHRTS